MTKQVFIINGSGGVGKDTVCSAAAQSWKVQNISSITPILQVAKAAGWDGTKTPAARRFLSQLKADCTEFNDLPFRYCTEQLQIFAENDAELLFVHIREPEEIERFRQDGRRKLQDHSRASTDTSLSGRADSWATARMTALQRTPMMRNSSTTVRWRNCPQKYTTFYRL